MERSTNLVISTQGLSKKYNGVEALKSLKLKVPENSIFSFLGPNGAGKTTTIKLLLGLAQPTFGNGSIFGLDIVKDSLDIRVRIGYLAQDPRFYEYMTARETLRFKVRFYYRGPESEIEARIAETLELVGLADKVDRPIKGFSGGERQRLGIAQAQVNNPDLLILDEPAASLDPMGRRDVLEVMERLRKHSTIFYSTHILDDVQRVSDASAAVAIENARLYLVGLDNARLEKAIQMAHDIQAGSLPQETPQVHGWEFAAHWQPAREVAGDYFDFIPGDNPCIGMVIDDVNGTGVPAALFMANTCAIIRACVNSAPSPTEAINQANRLISKDSTDGMFVTLFYALIDPENGEAIYVNAGHNPPLLYRGKQSQLLEFERTGMALGLISEATYGQRSVKLDPVDFIVLYTDGITDAINDQKRFFGLERLQRALLDNRHASAERLIAALRQEITKHIGEAASFDDIEIIATRYKV